MTRLHCAAAAAIILALASCGDPGEQHPPNAARPGDAMKGIRVIEGVELLAARTGKSVVVDPIAQPLSECARITIIPSANLNAAALEKLFSDSIEAVGLDLESTETTITIGYDHSRYLPAGCEEAVPVRGTGSPISYADRHPPRSGLRVRPNPTLPKWSEVDAGPGTSERPSPVRGQDYRELITKVSNNDYLIPRSVRDEALGPDGLNKHMRRVRIVPSYKNGEQIGFKLFSIRPGSFFSAIGLRNGDTVTGINGKPVNTPELALEALASIKKALKKITVQLSRRGKPEEINYRFVRG